MYGFAIDDKGDVIVEQGKIKTVSDTELITQTVRQILRTNWGEWEFNDEEGIDFSCIITKNPNYEQIENNIEIALKQVDETLVITNFECSVEYDRKLKINFTAENDSGEIINITL